jgi:hypothetical protein
MLCGVGNVTLPTPVFVAGGALCVLAGYLIGSVVAPDTPERTTAVVASYDSETAELCLTGDAIKDQEGAASNGKLCGNWRRTPGALTPTKGDKFRFVSVSTSGTSHGKAEHQVLIYGDIVK